MKYDVVIVGGGPAGLSAAIYSCRGMLKTIVLESGSEGGQIATTDLVENYPGSPKDTTGPSLAMRMKEQAEEFGAEFMTAAFTGFDKLDKKILIHTDHVDIEAQALILAVGAQARKLGCPGEDEHRGMGVSYCATCDANFFRNREIAVVGGGNTAVEEALYLTKFASKVTLIHRRDQLRAAKILADRAMENEKLHILWDTVVEEVVGEMLVEKLLLKNVKTGEKSELPVSGVFMSVGQEPMTDTVKGQITLDEKGYIITDADMHTNIEGVFAAGDVREKSLRQAVTAAADGAIAASEAIKYIDASK